MKNVVLFDYLVSSVKTEKISVNTILSIVELSYKGTDPKVKQDIVDTILEQLKKRAPVENKYKYNR